MEINKILWPTDFSKSAEKALQHVKSLTQKYQTEVHVLYVIEDTAHHEPWYGEFGQERVDKILEKANTTANQRLEQICNKYLEGCPLYIRHVAIGDPAREILNFIKKEKVDMVIMSTRGQQGLFPFGSVTEKVVKNSNVPVVTIPVRDDEI
ncbi:Universal stress protein, UspA-like [Desulfonema limicola]|uniref:Universal stress protein, UspA-like n=1 Tax=Desulfonema limicola TaxID=45656 RepID=A0A975B7R3_9BACT|nr:universal stress protein [Desulfonema limicola]QTA80373.1 Universal stress protein, UspA-like [Desulfonema limicola]